MSTPTASHAAPPPLGPIQDNTNAILHLIQSQRAIAVAGLVSDFDKSRQQSAAALNAANARWEAACQRISILERAPVPSSLDGARSTREAQLEHQFEVAQHSKAQLEVYAKGLFVVNQELKRAHDMLQSAYHDTGRQNAQLLAELGRLRRDVDHWRRHAEHWQDMSMGLEEYLKKKGDWMEKEGVEVEMAQGTSPTPHVQGDIPIADAAVPRPSEHRSTPPIPQHSWIINNRAPVADLAVDTNARRVTINIPEHISEADKEAWIERLSLISSCMTAGVAA